MPVRIEWGKGTAIAVILSRPPSPPLMKGTLVHWLALLSALLLCACAKVRWLNPGGGTQGGGSRAFLDCSTLPLSGGNTVTVTPSQAGLLPALVRDAAPQTTFLLEDGLYLLNAAGEQSRLQFRSPGVTLRSASGRADSVVLDGGYVTNEIVNISASDVTIAHVTIRRARHHPIHVSPASGTPDTAQARYVLRTLIYDVTLEDGGQQFVKINSNAARDAFVDYGVVQCSRFRMSSTGRAQVVTINGSCYTGGVDAHMARGWEIRNNSFEGIYCTSGGLAEHAVHLWSASRDTIVENNHIVNCARGIGFGMGSSGSSRAYPDDPYPGLGYIGHYDGIIRNNVIYADVDRFDTGIELEQARVVKVHHNTVLAAPSLTAFYTSLSYRFGNTLADIRNNLLVDYRQRDGAAALGNPALLNGLAPPLDWFVDPAEYDFHLVSTATGAIDQGFALDDHGYDLDGEARSDDAPDFGADER